MTEGEPGLRRDRRDEEFEREVERELARRDEARGKDRAQDNGHDTRYQEEEIRAREVSKSDEPRLAKDDSSGKFGLVARAVVANGPWSMFLSFKTVIATAFATGAYALIFPTIWLLADSMDWLRLAGLMAASVVIMIGWMILAHGLWERSSDEAERDSRVTPAMQNAVTLLTLTSAVLFSYAVLFGLIFLSAILFIPNGLLQSNLGHSVSSHDYAIIAWVATSISTITGSLGGGLEDEDEVREAVNFR